MATLEIGSTVRGWQVIARRTNKPARNLLGMMLQMMMQSPPMTWSSVTWTVRQISTGTVREVTARTEDDAEAMIGALDQS